MCDAGMDAILSLNGTHSTRSIPVGRSRATFSRNRVSRAGTAVPRKNSRGWGSNVISRLGRRNSTPFATTCASSFW